MREYELMFIVHPDLDETALKEVVERVKGWVTAANGQVSNVDIWGKRRLAFPIRKQKDGQYVLVKAQLEPSACAQIERNLRITEPIMRFLLASDE